MTDLKKRAIALTVMVSRLEDTRDDLRSETFSGNGNSRGDSDNVQMTREPGMSVSDLELFNYSKHVDHRMRSIAKMIGKLEYDINLKLSVKDDKAVNQ